MQVLTVSSMRMFRRCAREYEYRYEQGLVPADRAVALVFGSLFHDALEAWWKADLGSQLEVALEVIRQADIDPFDRAKAEVLMLAYHTRWEGAQYRALAVEQEFVTPLVNPRSKAPSRTWELRGKMDVVVEDEHGRPWIMEHKTTSEDAGAGSQYWQRLQLDSQVSTYYVGARSLGYDVMGCVYDVIGKPRHGQSLATPIDLRRYTQPKTKACPECKKKKSDPAPHAVQIGDGEMVYCVDGKVCTDEGGRLYAGQRDTDETVDEFRARLFEVVAEAPDKWVNRGPVVRLETEEIEAGLDAWQIGRLIREAQLGKRWPRNPDACQRYGRMCSYWPLCTRTGTTHDYTYKRPHSELAVVEGETP